MSLLKRYHLVSYIMASGKFKDTLLPYRAKSDCVSFHKSYDECEKFIFGSNFNKQITFVKYLLTLLGTVIASNRIDSQV